MGDFDTTTLYRTRRKRFRKRLEKEFSSLWPQAVAALTQRGYTVHDAEDGVSQAVVVLLKRKGPKKDANLLALLVKCATHRAENERKRRVLSIDSFSKRRVTEIENSLYDFNVVSY